jgi:Family of unknown function (DUF5662)
MENKSKYLDLLEQQITCVREAGRKLMRLNYLPLVYDRSEFGIMLDSHDRSKYKKEESEGYVSFYFPSEDKEKREADFQKFVMSRHHHIHNNPHHIEYWFGVSGAGEVTPLQIPDIYILHILANWIGKCAFNEENFGDWVDKYFHKFLIEENTKTKMLDCIKIIIDAKI